MSAFYDTYQNSNFESLDYYVAVGFDRKNKNFIKAFHSLDINMINISNKLHSEDNKIRLVEYFFECACDLSLLSKFNISRSPGFKKCFLTYFRINSLMFSSLTFRLSFAPMLQTIVSNSMR